MPEMSAAPEANPPAAAGEILLTTAAMAEADRRTIAAGTPGIELMERAGAAVARAAMAMVSPGAPVAIACGPGNNGGDGFIAARLLRDAGCSVAVTLLGSSGRLQGDAAEAFRRWGGAPAPALPLDKAALVIDALFGAGLSRDLGGEGAELVDSINASGKPVLAVDIPSGVDGNTGAVRGVAIRATATITFVRRKPGHLLSPGRFLCGETTVADIGVPDETVAAVSGGVFANGPDLWRASFPTPQADQHKYDRGHLLVVAGGLQGVGAPRLSARAGLRIGAGLVTIACAGEALAAHAGRGPDALMVRRADGAGELLALLEDRRLRALIIGPALGTDRAARKKLDAALASPVPTVLDADSFTLLAGQPDLIARAASQKPLVLTPHEGEFKRLFNGMNDSLEQDIEAAARSKLERARQAARLTSAVVVLKGPDTMIAAPDGRAAINGNAPPWLATAGSGDVLAGLIGGLLAQGMPAWEAACAAVWLHGAAGAAAGRGLIADDLPEAIVTVLRSGGAFA